MERLNAEANQTLRRIREFAVREELSMGDDIGDSGTLPTTIPDLLQRTLQKLGKLLISYHSNVEIFYKLFTVIVLM